jgi:hypothetical protein
MPVATSEVTTEDSQTRSVSQAPLGRMPKRRSILSESVAICVTRSRCGIAARTGSQSPEPNHSTCPLWVIAARRAMSSGKRSNSTSSSQPEKCTLNRNSG